MNKAEMLEAIQTERSTLESLLTAFSQALSEEDFTDPYRFPWTGDEGIITSIAANSFWHYRKHAEQIRAIR